MYTEKNSLQLSEGMERKDKRKTSFKKDSMECANLLYLIKNSVVCKGNSDQSSINKYAYLNLKELITRKKLY